MLLFKRMLPFSLPLSVLAAILVGSFAEDGIILSVINQSFLVGLACMMIGSCFFVINSGFFHVFSIGFGKLKGLFFRKPKVLESDFYQLKKSFPTASITSFLLTAGSFVLFFSVSLTLFYYFV